MSDEQPTLFDPTDERNPATARALGDAGASAAYNADAAAEWRTRADVAMERLIRSGVRFTAEDVTAFAGMPPNPNAVGGLFKAYRGRIRLVSYDPAGRKVAHGRRIGTWEAAPPPERNP